MGCVSSSEEPKPPDIKNVESKEPIRNEISQAVNNCKKNKEKYVIKNKEKLNRFKKYRKRVNCCVCLLKIPRLSSLVPCGHCNMCDNCFSKLKQKLCPICRQKILKRIRIYL